MLLLCLYYDIHDSFTARKRSVVEDVRSLKVTKYCTS